MTTDLMHLGVSPSPTQGIRQMRARDVARDLNATDKISSRVETNSLGPRSVKEERRSRFKHVLTQLLPGIPFSEDIFGKTFGAIATIALLDNFEHQFRHTSMIRHEFSGREVHHSPVSRPASANLRVTVIWTGCAAWPLNQTTRGGGFGKVRSSGSVETDAYPAS